MKLSEIKNELRKILMQFSVVKTDKAVLQYEGEELIVGTVVKIENEDGTTEIPTGEYVMEDGRTLVVENGEVKEIIEAPEVEPVEVVEPEAEPTEEETEPEVVEETPTEETVEPEAEPAEEETEPEQAEPTELEKKVAELEGKIAELEGKIAELMGSFEKMSVAKPAVEEFEQIKTIKKTGISKVDKFLEGINK
jgi:hypothetical protein